MSSTNGVSGRPRNPIGRPKRYRAHRDRGGVIVVADAVARVLQWVQNHASPFVQAKFTEATGITPEYKFFKRGVITFNDPRCCVQVIDVVRMTEPGSYIRPYDVTEYLNRTQSQWLWDVGVVGRILAGIRTACVEAYVRPVNSPPYETDEGDAPFSIGRDSGGRYYVLDPKGGNEGRLWMNLFRGRMYDRAVRQQGADQAGHLDAYIEREANAGWLVDYAPEPVRTVEAYEGQLRIVPSEGIEPGTVVLADPPVDFNRRVVVSEAIGRPAGE